MPKKFFVCAVVGSLKEFDDAASEKSPVYLQGGIFSTLAEAQHEMFVGDYQGVICELTPVSHNIPEKVVDTFKPFPVKKGK